MILSGARKLLQSSAINNATQQWTRSVMSSLGARQTSEGETDFEGKSEFMKNWKEDTLSPPMFQTEYIEQPEEGQRQPNKLNLNLYLPHQTLFKNAPVELAVVPAVTGDFGVMSDHVPTIAELRPGVLQVCKTSTDVEKYFVSSGFVFVHPDNTTDICAVEACKLDDVDGSAVTQALREWEGKLNSGTEYEQVVAQIGVEVYSALESALSTK
eukprot:TRINITY_DN27245_c0_g1_i1.p1 TRINITY_DN27245_c0_g1~~TRINITY_DN27245_c0_g1_i1.p1  ORF type:complete len:212 (-),score=29.87 TRINITY_DN27245_c0_g1_i1:341-976(-)